MSRNYEALTLPKKPTSKARLNLRPDHTADPSWLKAAPTERAVRPPIVDRGGNLPFGERPWEDFERLCRRLAATSGDVEEAWAYGVRGQKQYGIDILVRKKDGSYEVWQTKKYKTVKAQNVKDAVEIFLEHPWADKASKFVLAYACNLETTGVVEAIEEARTRINDRKIAFSPLDATRLTEMLVLQPEIIDDFFGRDWVEFKCPPEALQRLALRLGASIGSASRRSFPSGFAVAKISDKLDAQSRSIEVIANAQATLATKIEIAKLTDALSAGPAIATVLPVDIAERELGSEFRKILRRRGFVSVDTNEELATLARRAAYSDLTQASAPLRARICESAARSLATSNDHSEASAFRAIVHQLDPSRDLAVLDAFIAAGSGDPDKALRDLRTRGDPDSRTATLIILSLQRGNSVALKWAIDEGLKPIDFTPAGAINCVLYAIAEGLFEIAYEFISAIPNVFFDELSVLHLLRAQIKLGSLLPLDQKLMLTQGLPMNPRELDFALTPNAEEVKESALADLKTLISLLPELDLISFCALFEELELWLRLEIYRTRDAAYADLSREIEEPLTTLRRVRLALAYGVAFNQAALQRHLSKSKTLGGWTNDETFVALLLVLSKGNHEATTRFFEENWAELFNKSDLSPGYLALFEIQALAQQGLFPQARAKIERYRNSELTQGQADDLIETLAAQEAGDEVEGHRARYERTKSLNDLRALMQALLFRRDHQMLATYAPVLARATQTPADFGNALRALYMARRDMDLVALTTDFPDLLNSDTDFKSFRGWSLYRLGRLAEASVIARELVGNRDYRDDTELSINTAIESGDWGHLQAIVGSAVKRAADLSSTDLARFARLAHEIGSPYAGELRDLSVSKDPDSPDVLLAAYMLATEMGEDYQDSKAHEFFQRAVDLSGSDGPLRRVSLRELVDHSSGWREGATRTDTQFRQGEIPVLVAARASGRPVIELTYGQALRNIAVLDHQMTFPVFAFSGARQSVALNGEMRVAFDITTIATLEFLGKLDEAISLFKHVVVSPNTLSLLFAERQHIRVGQPTNVKKARRLQGFIASGLLTVVKPKSSRLSAGGVQMGHELATLLEIAKEAGGLVVRSAPVLKLDSYLEETVNMGPYSAQLTDTLRLVAFLFENGRIDVNVRDNALRYLRSVDAGWSASIEIAISTPLYLDSLTVTYLEYVGLLEPLIRSAGTVFVYQDVDDNARQILKQTDIATELLEAIDRIRASIVSGVERGSISFSERRPSEDGSSASESGQLDRFQPTFDLISNLSGVDAIAVDDRYLNRLPEWADTAGRHKVVASTLDILGAMKTAGHISEPELWDARTRLRAAAFYAVPIEVKELVHHLDASPASADAVRETPALRMIRESLALPLANASYVASEALWLNSVRLSIYQAIRQIWSDNQDVQRAELEANWLLSVLPDPQAWCTDPDDPSVWAMSQQQLASQTGLMTVFLASTGERRLQYYAWIEREVLAPLKESQPEVWDATIDFLKHYLLRLSELNNESQ